RPSRPRPQNGREAAGDGLRGLFLRACRRRARLWKGQQGARFFYRARLQFHAPRYRLDARPREGRMKLVIFYELQLPRPWGPDSELTLYHNALDQLELADRLGYDFAWEVEHHFLEEYSHSPAPEVFLAAASQRTRQIRLAHGIMQLTTVHPARIAALDLVSRGRVEFGMGESASITELEPFDRSFDEKRAVWEDAVRAVIPMFKEGGCEYHGTY